jgi:hypothetical protein
LNGIALNALKRAFTVYPTRGTLEKAVSRAINFQKASLEKGSARDLIWRRLPRWKTLVWQTSLLLGLMFCGTTVLFAQDAKPRRFGQIEQSEAAMIGILYDFKQTQDHKPTNVDPASYVDVLDEFFSKGWDEKVLERFYRVSRPLYTTQIFIPIFDANEAPKEFGVEKTVQPSRWIVHYKAQVSPPADGTYRLVAYADDVCAAAINGKTVVIGGRPDIRLKKTGWKPTEKREGRGISGDLVYGDWITLKKDDIVDLDVVIGERPGGQFGAFLMVQKQGDNYPPDENGNPTLPIFQVAPYDTPPRGNAPKFSTGAPNWKSYQ